MKKSILNLILSTLLLFNIGQTSEANSANYLDIDSKHWAYKQIKVLSDEGVVKGYPDGTFKPDEKITRAEFATMAIKSLGQDNFVVKNAINFKDLDKKHWAFENIQRAVYFDLVKGTNTGEFLPQNNVTNAQTLAVSVNALSTRSLSKFKAKEIVENKFSDYLEIPSWILISTAKAIVLDMVPNNPANKGTLNPNQPSTRAEACVWLYNMREQAKLNPNAKLAEVMKPKMGIGIVIDDVEVKGTIATIPAGTKLPVAIINSMSSQTNNVGDLFIARVPKNYLTPQKYILIAQNTPIAGQVLSKKYGRLFVRNGKLVMETQTIKLLNNQNANFKSLVDTKVKRGFWASLGRAIFKGGKVNFENDQILEIELLKPVKIDLLNGWIID